MPFDCLLFNVAEPGALRYVTKLLAGAAIVITASASDPYRSNLQIYRKKFWFLAEVYEIDNFLTSIFVVKNKKLSVKYDIFSYRSESGAGTVIWIYGSPKPKDIFTVPQHCY